MKLKDLYLTEWRIYLTKFLTLEASEVREFLLSKSAFLDDENHIIYHDEPGGFIDVLFEHDAAFKRLDPHEKDRVLTTVFALLPRRVFWKPFLPPPRELERLSDQEWEDIRKRAREVFAFDCLFKP